MNVFLQKLYETYDVVGVMEQQVRDMEPVLAKKAEEGIILVNKLKIEQKAADEVKQAVMKDEAEAKVHKLFYKPRSYQKPSISIAKLNLIAQKSGI